MKIMLFVKIAYGVLVIIEAILEVFSK